MTRPRIDDIELNAYVDGELPPDQAAALARRAAAEPDLAQRIARLHRIKAAVASTVDAATQSAADRLTLLPEQARRRPRAVARGDRRGWRAALVAATLVLGLTVGGAAMLRQPGPGAAPDPALALHDAWATGGGGRGGDLPAAEAPAWLTSVIAATGLQLVHSASLEARGLPAGMHYAFVGSNDCRLSLFEMRATDPQQGALTLQVEGDLRSARWQAGGHDYMVLARNMDAARFATIAAALGEAAASRAGPDAERLALLTAARQRCLS